MKLANVGLCDDDEGDRRDTSIERDVGNDVMNGVYSDK